MKQVPQFRIFVLFWTLFILIHHTLSLRSWTHVGVEWLNPSHPFFLVCGILTAVCAIWTIFKLQTLPFLLTLVFWSLLKFDNLPQVPNHIILALLVNIMWIMILLYQFIRRKPDPERAYTILAPYLRICLVIVYLFTVFHKLNVDYLNREVSCAVDLYSNLSDSFWLFPSGSGIDYFVIYTTLLIEALIPILLISRRLWRYGVLLAIGFHTLLSLHDNVYITSFSAEIFALLLVFIPSQALNEIVAVVSRLWNRFALRRLPLFLALSIAFSAITFFVLSIYLVYESGGDQVKPLLQVFWIIFCLTLFFLVFLIQSDYRREKISQMNMPVFFIFPILVVLNGVSPYFGLKTATNFSMFSNLWVKGEDNNHLLVGQNIVLLDYSKDLVDIVHSDQPYFQKLAENHEQITLFELSRWITEHPDLPDPRLVYRRNNQLYQHDKATDIPTFSWMERKFLIYRILPARRPCPCQW